jgi:hypothetical protein
MSSHSNSHSDLPPLAVSIPPSSSFSSFAPHRSNSNEISAVPSSPVPLLPRSPVRSVVDRDEISSKSSRKRKSSGLPSINEIAKLQSFAIRRNTYLSLVQNYLPFRVEMKPIQIYSSAPSISILVWLLGFNTDPTSGILRRKDGLQVYFQYSEYHSAKSRTSFYHSENVNQALLCSLFSRISSNTLLFPDFHSHLQSGRPLAELFARSHITSHRQLLYRNTEGEYKFLHDLLPSSFAFKLKSNIPASVAKLLRPMKDSEIKVDRKLIEEQRKTQALSLTSETESEEENEQSATEEENAMENSNKKKKVEEKAQVNKTKEKSKIKEKLNEQKEKRKNEKNDEERTIKLNESKSRARSCSPSSSTDSSVSLPDVPSVSVPSPFARFSFMCIHWSLHSSESNGISSSIFNELARRSASSQLLGVQDIADGTDLEYLLTQIHVRVLAALNAPVIPMAISLDQKIERILSYLPNSSQSNPSSFQAIPLRVDDSCIILLSRSLFDQRVWPLLISTMPMFELNSNTELEVVATVKSEPGLIIPVNSSKGKDSSIMLAQRVVAQFVRNSCKGTSFWLYSLPSPSVESQFFAPIQANCLYSLESGAPLHKPVLLEWPRGLPFEPSIPLHWARFCIQPAGPGQTQRLLISLPALQWNVSNIRTMQNTLDSPAGAPGNLVKLLRAAVSAQPIPGASSNRSREQKILIESDATYLILELLVSQPAPSLLSFKSHSSLANSSRISPRKGKSKK